MNSLPVFLLCLLACSAFGGFQIANAAIVPQPKSCQWGEAEFELEAVDLSADDTLFETILLREILEESGVVVAQNGTPLKLGIGTVTVPEVSERHQEEIVRQAYEVTVDESGISITANDRQGLYYGVQTFRQLLEGKKLVPVHIVDYPDLPIRMLMVDPARQNENMQYYRRVIRFAAQYKINAVLCHLTDDQTSALYHEDYPELMHHQAWRPAEVRELVAFAERHHVTLTPEIESLGHSRMFTRMEDYADYLHQTEDPPDRSWMGTEIEGYTNVLCPASDRAVEYLDKMYSQAGDDFDSDWLHIGFDEVDMTRCERCISKYGEQTEDEWMSLALDQASSLVSEKGMKTALWGDMLLSHPAVLDSIDPDSTIVFDWNYTPGVTDKGVKIFREKGLEVITCPALSCAPRMIMPNEHNYENIRRFTAIAREHDLLGVNTTIWVPTRYMSDVLWTGIAFATAHAWAGSNLDEKELFEGFTKDFFGSDEGVAYHDAWKRRVNVFWERADFNAGLWMDDASLERAKEIAADRGQEIQTKIDELSAIEEELARIGDTVEKNEREWQVIEQSVAIQKFTMERLLAAADIQEDIGKHTEFSNQLRRYIRLVEADWGQNRYTDDPGRDGRFLQSQHLLYRLKQAADYSAEILGENSDRVPRRNQD